MALRRAEPADWPTAWKIQRAAFLDLVTRTSGGWTEALEERCALSWNARHSSMIDCDGRTVGWLRVTHAEDHDWLDLIVLAPEVQGVGIGSEVMKALMGAADARGVPLWLSVYRTNSAVRLYRRLGFRELPRDEVRVFMCFSVLGDETPPAWTMES